MILNVKVVPRSSEDRIVGFLEEGTLKVKLTAPPADGKANEALVRLLAKELGVARSAVTIKRGAASRRKAVEILGMEERMLKAKFGNEMQK